MKIIERWREHRGSVDERVEAESNRVYKLGFVMLSFGVLVYLYYDWSLKQAMCMRDVLANGAGRMEFTSADLFLYGWFALTMIVGMVLLVRKGFGDDNRFAEAEQFPIGYYAIASIAFAVAVAVDGLSTGLRVLAVFQVLGAGEIMWPAVAFGSVFALVAGIPLFLLGFWVAFKSAQSRRRQLDMRLGE